MEKLMDIDDLAEMLGAKKTMIYSWIAGKKIPHIKLTDKIVKFREKDIMAWLAQKTVSAEAPVAKARTKAKVPTRTRVRAKADVPAKAKVPARAKAPANKVIAIGGKDRHYGRPSSALTDEYIDKIVRNAQREVLGR